MDVGAFITKRKVCRNLFEEWCLLYQLQFCLVCHGNSALTHEADFFTWTAKFLRNQNTIDDGSAICFVNVCALKFLTKHKHTFLPKIETKFVHTFILHMAILRKPKFQPNTPLNTTRWLADHTLLQISCNTKYTCKTKRKWRSVMTCLIMVWLLLV